MLKKNVDDKHGHHNAKHKGDEWSYMSHRLDLNILIHDDGQRPTSFKVTLQKDQTPPELPELVPPGAKDDALKTCKGCNVYTSVPLLAAGPAPIPPPPALQLLWAKKCRPRLLFAVPSASGTDNSRHVVGILIYAAMQPDVLTWAVSSLIMFFFFFWW